MTPNKYNEQIDLAREVGALLVKPLGRETFTRQLNVFRDWNIQWSKDNAECLQKRQKLNHLDFKADDKVEKINEKINNLWNEQRSKNQMLCQAAQPARMEEVGDQLNEELRAALEPLQKERNQLSRKRQRYRSILAKLNPSEENPCARLTCIHTYSMNELVTGLMKSLRPVKPMKTLDVSRSLCLRYTRLSILYDKALQGDGALDPLTTNILDPEDKDNPNYVENVWITIDDKWQSWRVVLNDDLECVKAKLLAIEARGGKKEQPWDENNPDYMSASDAVAKLADGKISLSEISKRITPDGNVHYMRRGHRRRVHIGDFISFIKKEYPHLAIKPEVLDKYTDEYLADIETRKAKQRNRK